MSGPRLPDDVVWAIAGPERLGRKSHDSNSLSPDTESCSAFLYICTEGVLMASDGSMNARSFPPAIPCDAWKYEYIWKD